MGKTIGGEFLPEGLEFVANSVETNTIRLDARMIASFVAVMPTRRNPRGGRYV
jgi:hypothetical protein